MKPKIQEVIVVEGKDDTQRIKEAVTADTIETMGSAINQEILEQIKHAAEFRGVIVFTDPDFAGEKIRKQIMKVIPGVKHAFLAKDEAKPSSKSKGKSLGVEHASNETIIEALEKVFTPVVEDYVSEIDQKLLNDLGLIGYAQSRKRRMQIGESLRIGYTNGKQFLKRLQMFQITKEQLIQATQAYL
ncbi:MAG: ribonuclease M5 [Lactobacillales bacterium]|jgi:ribonuclease M5|nr:ribonuclease M5 [Lactobacillales bacterium]